jgi:hypothetical protein
MKELLFAAALLAVCVVIHAVALSHLLRWLERRGALGQTSFLRSTWMLIGVAWRLVLSHVLQVMCWGALYAMAGAFDDLTSCAYFSVVTYTTVGYGDLVPPERLRLAAGVEGLTGILMCGLSTAFFFTVVSRMHRPIGGEHSRGC